MTSDAIRSFIKVIEKEFIVDYHVVIPKLHNPFPKPVKVNNLTTNANVTGLIIDDDVV